MSDNYQSRHRTALLAFVAVFIVAMGLIVFSTLRADATTTGSGTSPADPFVVDTPSEVPATAVEDNPSTYGTANPCDTTRSWVQTTPAVSETQHAEYRFKRVIPAQPEVKEYTFDKFVQKQKAKWGNAANQPYTGPISAGYPGSYTWRDAGFDPVTNTTGVTPTAPSPQRGDFIHNSGGYWYFTFFYEYRKISERVVTPAQPSYTEFYVLLGAPSRSEAAASWVLDSQRPAGWTQFAQRSVGNGDAKPEVKTFYVWSDNKVCETVTPTPTPPPPTTTPPTPVTDANVSVSTRCTGTTVFKGSNTGETAVVVKMKAKHHGKTVFSKSKTLQPGATVRLTKHLPNFTKAIVTTTGDRDVAVVPKPCPEPPDNKPPHTGKRKAA